MLNDHKKGMTALEILLIMAVLGIIFAIVIPQFSKMKENQVLKNAVGDVSSSLNKARSETLASLGSSSYGVHFQSDKIIIFKGTVFSPSDSNNEIINIISPATISNVTLAGVSGSSGDVYFNRLSGIPNKATPNFITISTDSSSRIITISATGLISID